MPSRVKIWGRKWGGRSPPLKNFPAGLIVLQHVYIGLLTLFVPDYASCVLDSAFCGLVNALLEDVPEDHQKAVTVVDWKTTDASRGIEDAAKAGLPPRRSARSSGLVAL